MCDPWRDDACVVHECLQWEEIFCWLLVVVSGPTGVVASIFAEMLIHFHFGKFLHYPYVLILGKVMPNFFRLAFMHVCVHMVWFSPILSVLTAQATMVLTMSEGRIAR